MGFQHIRILMSQPCLWPCGLMDNSAPCVCIFVGSVTQMYQCTMCLHCIVYLLISCSPILLLSMQLMNAISTWVFTFMPFFGILFFLCICAHTAIGTVCRCHSHWYFDESHKAFGAVSGNFILLKEVGRGTHFLTKWSLKSQETH